MKIIYITHSNVWDGSTVALYRIVVAMKEKGHEVFVICSDEEGPFIDKLNEIGVKHYCHRISLSVYPKVNNPLKWIKRTFRYMYRAYKERKFIEKVIDEVKPDIFHTNVGPLSQAFDVCKKMGIPHVWHQREYQDLDFDMHFFPTKGTFIRKINDENNYNISITKDIFEYRNLRKDRDIVVYDGVFTLKQAEELKNIKEKENYVLFAGRIEPAKGAFYLISVFEKFHELFPETKLLLAGNFSNLSDYYNKCSSFVIEHKMEDYVEFLGARDDIYNLMAKAKMLVVPSRFEGFGFITTEAMLNHCVVVGHNTAGTKEQFDNGFAEVGREIGYRFDKSEDMLDCMIKAMSDDTSRMIEDAYHTVVKLYNVERNINKIEELYNKILDKRKYEKKNI